MPRFPSFFPDNFAEEMLPEDAREESHFGYRIAKYGVECPFSYVSSYEDRILEGKETDGDYDAGEYSTSLFDIPDRLRYILRVTLRYTFPKACVVSGYTHPSCGPSKIGSKRRYKRPPDSAENGPHTTVYLHHIHWWVYEGACPWEYFEKAGDE